MTIPSLYETEDVPMLDKTVHVHYFVAAADWWLFELDPETGNALAFVCLGDPAMAEVGYVNISELEATRIPQQVGQSTVDIVIERDIHWNPQPVSEAIPKALHRSWWASAEEPTTT